MRAPCETPFQSTVDPDMADRIVDYILRIREGFRIFTPERLTELDVSLDAWVERAGVSQLAEVFRKWIVEGLALQVGEPGEERVQDIWKEETDDMSMMLEWARQRGEERDRRERQLRQQLEQGRREGIERARALVRRLAARRFDAETVGRLVPVLDSLSDPDRIEAVADAVVEARTGDELLARASEV